MTSDQIGELLSLEAIEKLLNEKVELFNQRIPHEPKYARFVADMERRVLIRAGESVGFVSRLSNSLLAPLERIVVPTGFEADIILTMDHATLSGMLSGQLKPVKAYATKRLKVKAQVKDLLMLKKLLQDPKKD